MRFNPWLAVAILLVVICFGWGLLCFLYYACFGPIIGQIRWRLKVRRYWRDHPRGPVDEWEAKHNA